MQLKMGSLDLLQKIKNSFMSDKDAARVALLYNSLSIGLSLEAKMNFWRAKTRTTTETSHIALQDFENAWLDQNFSEEDPQLKLGYDY